MKVVKPIELLRVYSSRQAQALEDMLAELALLEAEAQSREKGKEKLDPRDKRDGDDGSENKEPDADDAEMQEVMKELVIDLAALNSGKVVQLEPEFDAPTSDFFVAAGSSLFPPPSSLTSRHCLTLDDTNDRTHAAQRWTCDQACVLPGRGDKRLSGRYTDQGRGPARAGQHLLGRVRSVRVRTATATAGAELWARATRPLLQSEPRQALFVQAASQEAHQGCESLWQHVKRVPLLTSEWRALHTGMDDEEARELIELERLLQDGFITREQFKERSADLKERIRVRKDMAKQRKAERKREQLEEEKLWEERDRKLMLERREEDKKLKEQKKQALTRAVLDGSRRPLLACASTPACLLASNHACT
jgi:hypothetical protein